MLRFDPMRFTLVLLVATAAIAEAQASPRALVDTVVAHFASGSAESFQRVYPDSDGRALVAQAIANGWPRIAGPSRVVWQDASRAIVLLSGFARFGSSGDETSRARVYSGLYEAEPQGGRWHLVRKIPIDGGNRIESHTLAVTLAPGKGLDVVDDLRVHINGTHGFAARINHRADLRTVTVDGRRPASVAFGGGIIWLPASPGAHRIRLSYSVAVESDTTDTQNASFQPNFGHVRATHLWHPLFEYDSPNDRARFDVTVRAPARIGVSTSLPQSESVRENTRIVHGVSEVETNGISLAYDRDWRPSTSVADGIRVEVFATRDYKPERDSLIAHLSRVLHTIRDRFGSPPSKYLAIVQARAIREPGFHYRNNGLVLSGVSGGAMASGGSSPYANLAHEIAHGWTRPTGRGSHFVHEGWATYVEGAVVTALFGADAERGFWERRRNQYLAFVGDGRTSIMREAGNNLIHYSKGPWIFRMLEQALGDSVFDRGMRRYIAISVGDSAGLPQLTRALSIESGRDVHSVLRPWLEETTIPDVRARVDGQRIVLEQTARYEMPIEIEIGGTDTTTRTIWLRSVADTIDVAATPARVRVDPSNRLLLKRRWGEQVRFQLRAPDAREVQLLTDFSRTPLPARREGDEWVVELPLSSGRYQWWWRVDGRVGRAPEGEPARSGVIDVRPVLLLEKPLP
jgi:hypothetical protein